MAKMCGVDKRTLYSMATNWHIEKMRPRGKKILKLLLEAGYDQPYLYLRSEHNGNEVNAYTEPVCVALLEYFAFDSPEPRPEAQKAYRSLVRTSFRAFIYTAVGYSPQHKSVDQWKDFHLRVSLTTNTVPDGYFCVFREMSIMLIPLINSGVMISDKVVPDISAGIHWGNHWEKNNLDSVYGKRIRFEHHYPDYYPQSKSNPQMAQAYPNAGLGSFRDWLLKTYIVTKFPDYLLKQAKSGYIAPIAAIKALGALEVNNETVNQKLLDQ